MEKPRSGNEEGPTLWYKDAVIYELHVRSFFDSNADGIGDFPGLTQKLDYLADLGVTALWLLPFYPSPLKDGGYDISDYRSIDPGYGTLKDWRVFLKEAHRRGLRVITELVLNHTSDQHPWFQKSRRAAAGTRWRDYYVWTENPEQYKQARVIFKDFELSNWTWDPLAKAYFWHRFYAHQPDLNFDCSRVRRELFKVIDFWLDQGVDGLRLDAVPYLYERENTSCENLPETHQYLKELRRHVDLKYKDRVLLAEANQWPEEAVNYFGQGTGDECHMAFHFPLMPRLFMGIQMEDRVPIVDILEQTPPLPSTAQWALFLRNHDELTLEMVTDEERDYMYRMYAQDAKARLNLGIRRRLAPLLGSDRRKIELLNLLLLSMPGTPVIYYGDEIGMGDNIYLGDRNGVRTPMQWNSDKNAGFSRVRPQALPLPVVEESEYHYESVNVEAQQLNESSLLWWTKRLLNLRKRWRAFGRGNLEFVPAGNRKVLAFIRRYEEESVLVVANLSRLPQPTELNLAAYKGYCPVELRGNVEFPLIMGQPYVMTLSAYSAFWFWLRPGVGQQESEDSSLDAEMVLKGEWRDVLSARLEGKFARAVKRYLQQQSWSMAKSRRIEAIGVQDLLEPPHCGELCLALLSVEFLHGEKEEYLLPLGFAAGDRAKEIVKARPGLLIANVRTGTGSGIIYDGIGSGAFLKEVLSAIAKRRSWKGREGVCRTWKIQNSKPEIVHPGTGEQPVLFNRSNTGLVLEEGYFFKLFRKLEGGTNPEIEIEQMLAQKHYLNIPPLVGTLEYQAKSGQGVSLGVLSRIVPEGKNAWLFTQDILELFLDRVQAKAPEERTAVVPSQSLMSAVAADVPGGVSEMVGHYSELARLLGQRAGELHSALADPELKEFAPEPFTPFYLRSLYQSLRNRVMESMELMRSKASGLPADTQRLALKLLERQNSILAHLKRLYRPGPQGVRIRCHGSFHLGEVLYTGKDFFIIDFEGDAARPVSERRIKRPPVYDLAKMILSFHTAAFLAVEKRIRSGGAVPEAGAELQAWGEAWAYWVAVAFLKGYLNAIKSDLLKQSHQDLDFLLNSFLIDRAAKAVMDDLKVTPALAGIPMAAWQHTLNVWHV